jgi:transposase
MMSAAVQASLKAELAQEHGFRSYGEIVDWLAQEHGLVMEYGTVYDWGYNRWGANLKVPRPQSVKQSPERVMDFKKTRCADDGVEELPGTGSKDTLLLPG